VHFDLTHRNLLRTPEGDLHVVDCDAIDDGDRFYDLVTFALSFRTAGVDPGVEQGVEPGVEEDLWRWLQAHLTADALSAYVAHMVLRRVEWKIRLGTKAEVDSLIPRMAARLAAVG
jgi:thiamine kinase-like enzyme